MTAPVPILRNSSPAESDGDISLPLTPPPSLASHPSSTTTTMTMSSRTYPRNSLLALQTPHLPPPHPTRLASFSPILRASGGRGSGSSSDPESQWGGDEEHASLFDDEPVSKMIPIPRGAVEEVRVHPADQARKGSASASASADSDSGSEVLFHFASAASDRGVPMPLPIMIDFKNPFASSLLELNSEPQEGQSSGELGLSTQSRNTSGTAGSARASASASMGAAGGWTAFQSFPSSVRTSKDHLRPISISALGNEHNALRISFSGLSAASNTGTGIRPRSISPAGSISSRSSFSSASASAGGSKKLNPFAAPFPLPATQSTRQYSARPSSIALPLTTQQPTSSPAQASQISSQPSLPSLPMPLPASLPARPGPLPPVFIKRESAALPQPMSLPDIAPLGKGWEGDASLSGNDRRRLSAVDLLPSATSTTSSSAPARKGGVKACSAGTSSELGRTSLTHQSQEAAGASTGQRPERLVMLGRKLRESVSAQRTTIKA